MRRPFLAVTLVVAPDLTEHTDVIVGVVNTVFCRRGAFAILGADLETDLFPHGSNVCFNLNACSRIDGAVTLPGYFAITRSRIGPRPTRRHFPTVNASKRAKLTRASI
jgi:hypothetical protein